MCIFCIYDTMQEMKDEIVPYSPNEEGVVIYRTDDNTLQLDVQVANETVWLTQDQIAILFGTQRPAITKHLNNIYNSGELDFESTCSILERMGNDGKQRYQTKYYNLDAILSVGYRVNSKNATLFRRWATKNRFLCIDNTVYLIGASIKDLGKKWFGFVKLEQTTDELLSKM